MPNSRKQTHETIIRNLDKKTGKNLQQWIDLLKKTKLRERRELIEWLRIKHHLNNDQAHSIVKMMYEAKSDRTENDLIKKHFDGEKDFQKPIYDKIVSAMKKWGVHTVAANKTYLSFINNNHQFAIVKTIKEGLVIGVAREAVKAGRNKEFVLAKNLGSSKITHKIVLHDVSDVNDSIIRVLKAAYEKS